MWNCLENCPGITIWVSTGDGHGFGHWIGHGISHGVSHLVSHWVSHVVSHMVSHGVVYGPVHGIGLYISSVQNCLVFLNSKVASLPVTTTTRDGLEHPRQQATKKYLYIRCRCLTAHHSSFSKKGNTGGIGGQPETEMVKKWTGGQGTP